jgi:hypothetical protein
VRSKSCAVALESDERLARGHYSDVGDDSLEKGVESGCVVKVRIPRIWSANIRRVIPSISITHMRSASEHGRRNPRIESVKCPWEKIGKNDSDIAAWTCSGGIDTRKFELAQSCRGEGRRWRIMLILATTTVVR